MPFARKSWQHCTATTLKIWFKLTNIAKLWNGAILAMFIVLNLIFRRLDEDSLGPKSSINQAHIYSLRSHPKKIQYDPSWTLLTWFSYRVCVSVYLCTFSDNFGGLNFKKSSFSANFLVGHSRDLSIHSRYSIGEACVCTSIIGNWQGTLIESTNFLKSWSCS